MNIYIFESICMYAYIFESIYMYAYIFMAWRWLSKLDSDGTFASKVSFMK
jgi:hypothetical protein